MAPKHRWSHEEITEMRTRLESETLEQVGQHYGISRERVRQLAGNVNRRRPPGWKNPRVDRAAAKKELILRLFNEGCSDTQIAAEVGLSLGTVQNYRAAAGCRRLNRYTPEHSLWCLDEWVELFGYVPAASDWNPSQARKQGHHERAERFEQFREQFGCPYASNLIRQFGSWNEFIARGGYQPRGFGDRNIPWRKN